jgi:glycosyltransferase involved in cell wall biosynthesis
MSAVPELSVVVPVFNEEAAIGGVLRAWAAQLDRLGVSYELRVYDDGSDDQTPELLAGLGARLPRLCTFRHPNRGHGPTILRGYREAAGDWVFQADGDGEIPASAFSALWERRRDYDFLLGHRHGRHSPVHRRIVSLGSRLAVRTLFGSGLSDVNSPFRLVRGAALRDLLRFLPDGLFAPNVALAGLAVRRGLRLCEIPVPHIDRVGDRGSLASWQIWRGAARTLLETMSVARSVRLGAQ